MLKRKDKQEPHQKEEDNKVTEQIESDKKKT